LHKFANNYLSAFYFDILKDRLYTFTPTSVERRAAQTVLYLILKSLVKLTSPVLSFTAEEVWSYINKMGEEKEESVFLSSWPEVNPEFIDMELEEKWEIIINLREEVLKKMEEARQQKKISSSLDAKLSIKLPQKEFDILNELGEEALKEVFIVSQIELDSSPAVEIKVDRAKGKKCDRCWSYSERVGENKNHPSLCEKCWKVVEEIGLHEKVS